MVTSMQNVKFMNVQIEASRNLFICACMSSELGFNPVSPCKFNFKKISRFVQLGAHVSS